ncbi:MAG: hypothetical protein RIM72_16285 [Alphaproteobacteria bacterium]|jgi:hypothetical protein
MALVDFHNESSAHLYEAYRGLREKRPDSSWAEIAERMLEVLPHLEKVCASADVWGLLSHYRLCLLSRRDYRSRPHVVVFAGPGGYMIRYQMTSADAPFPNAIVEGATTNVEEAAQYVAIAIDRSGGWSSYESRLQDEWSSRRGDPIDWKF